MSKAQHFMLLPTVWAKSTLRAEEFYFQHWPHVDLCWRAGRPRECCQLASAAAASLGCWDDFWSPDHCCRNSVVHVPVLDPDCVSSEVLPKPSTDAPFLFLWDEKAGGSTFNRWLLESAANEGMLPAMHISDFWWPNIIGAAYFLAFYGETRRRELAIVSGSFDWRAVESLCLPQESGQASGGHTSANALPVNTGQPFPAAASQQEKRRQVHCFVLLRDPVDRFVSYWLERSDRNLELDRRRTLAEVPPSELSAYLDSIRAGVLNMTGLESGVGCNREIGICLRPDFKSSTHVELSETEVFRMLGGPQNRLARMLDPAGGAHPRFEVAARRLERCTVGLIDKVHRSELRAILAHRLPWIREVLMSKDSELHMADITQKIVDNKPIKSYEKEEQRDKVWHYPSGVRDAKRNHYYGSESEQVRKSLSPEARQLIARFNDVDTPLFHLGMQIFKRQAAEARLQLFSNRVEHIARQQGVSSGSFVLDSNVLQASLNMTYLESHTWQHHFEDLDFRTTRFMTEGLKCLLTSRVLPCTTFLGIEHWPPNQDALLRREELEALIRKAYPTAVAAYFVDDERT